MTILVESGILYFLFFVSEIMDIIVEHWLIMTQ